ncbi:signal recognition particle subunit FFH/SRP54 (srp54) [Thermoanaerobacter thermohydrosulfuricus]|uniref:Signal recognition particle protein n=5 Tax=Thermoanaerobacter TaxID=1754 RepID=B0K9W8_THEP3|nr:MULTISPECIES: signal recognition particle protein [Thermoanaerobacter]EGD52933.1 signal recognition particle protein [Thermoanaerobacter ethanolicus JW 200]EIW01080.1 LOW QUALITY PROTEIN: signal recognition particle protein [Thermoanaerobacter siderophilus SR4]ABY94931.1 signal recognition particle protein [Thermoanaerobacter pseudethanolicus ATCC 33223]ADV79880.1 signal recognition particle protein [Thermoanaerobacter brockii subsp. finnii Ako-1]EMT40209.1 signal recognition particle prote
MAFESLSERLQEIFKKLRGKGKLTEKDIKEAMREVKVALLEADVNFKVVKDFINSVTEKALGQEVMESLTPGQQVIKIVNDELIALMGSTQSRLNIGNKVPAVIMMVGLQGSGKTTACGKLANLLKKQGKNPLLVACDVVRPAAIKQLQVVGANVNVPVFTMGDKVNPVDIAKASIDYARSHNSDVIIIDTAGRLHIDEELMEELVNIKKAVQPDEILLVVDAMTGQDAVNVASSFNERLDITGVILTKLDGDTRGGAALSIKAVTQKPIKYVGTGEKLTDLEPFYPDRMASRILGMGDVLTLIEKAQAAIDEKKAQELGQKLLTKQFTLEDFLEQLQSLKNMGPLDQLLSMIPGMNKNMLKNVDISEKDLKRIEAIIQSMTKEERQNPSIINGSRKKRIAKGSGTTIQQVNSLLKQFEETKKMMKKFADIDKDLKKGKMRLPFFR